QQSRPPLPARVRSSQPAVICAAETQIIRPTPLHKTQVARVIDDAGSRYLRSRHGPEGRAVRPGFGPRAAATCRGLRPLLGTRPLAVRVADLALVPCSYSRPGSNN